MKTHCDGNQCDPSYEGDADSAATLGNVSTVGFVIGGLGVGAGVVLLVLRSGSDTAEAPVASSRLRGPFARPTVEPVVGLGAAGLRGRF